MRIGSLTHLYPLSLPVMTRLERSGFDARTRSAESGGMFLRKWRCRLQTRGSVS